MAKQLVGPVERHMEKAVMGVAGLALVGVIAKFLVMSPVYIQIGGETVGPAAIGKKIEEKAAQTRDGVERFRPTRELPEPLYPAFTAQLDPFAAGGLKSQVAAAVSFGPPVPIIDAPETVKGHKKLLEIVRLPKPAVTFGRTTFNMSDEVNPILVVDNWVTVSALFDRKQQIALQKQQYGAKYDAIVFGSVQLQRREHRRDGTWSDEDWEFVDSWPAAKASAAPLVTLESAYGQIKVSDNVRKEVLAYRDAIDEGPVQVEFLRPVMPAFWNGTEWTFPTLTNYRDVLLQDKEFLNPDAEESEIVDRYGTQDLDEAPEKQAVALTPQQQIDESFKLGEDLMRRADANNSENQAIEAYNAFQEIVVGKDTNPTDKNRATRMRAEAEQLIRDIKRRQQRGGPMRGPVETGAPKRILLPHQQVWANDARHGSVESGRTYQYRMRVLVFNELAAEPEQFENKTDATVVLVEGEWSPPSDPVYVEPDSQFFLSGFDGRQETVRVELYQWFDGVWVRHRESFGVGDRLRAQARKEVPIRNSTEIDRPQVTFDPGFTVVDIDFERPYRERRARASGVTFPEASAISCAAVFADSNGAIHERFVLSDNDNPIKKDLALRLFKP